MTTAAISLPTSGVQVLSDRGSGRVFVTVLDDLSYEPLARALSEQLSKRARSVVVLSEAIRGSKWESLSESLATVLRDLGVRQASLIGLAAGATLAQNLALSNPKLVRTLAVVDASARPHPSLLERLVDSLEARLPFGLPLRLGNRGFNVKSYLHRLRCPLLVVSTARASTFIQAELASLAQLAPTAWRVSVPELSRAEETSVLMDAFLSFHDVPAKCPQKNVGVAV